jgi:hypothetical protein
MIEALARQDASASGAPRGPTGCLLCLDPLRIGPPSGLGPLIASSCSCSALRDVVASAGVGSRTNGWKVRLPIQSLDELTPVVFVAMSRQ